MEALRCNVEKYYEIHYLGHVIDGFYACDDDEAKLYREAFVRGLMAGKFPGYLDSGDFADHDDCRKQHKLVTDLGTRTVA